MMDKFGIVLFRTLTHPVQGEVKAFCHDFIVHEIDLNGNLIHLSDQGQAIAIPQMMMPQNKEGNHIPSTANHQQGDSNSESLQELEQQFVTTEPQDSQSSYISLTSNHQKSLDSGNNSSEVMGDHLVPITQNLEVNRQQIRVAVSKKVQDQFAAILANDESNHLPTTSSYQQNPNNNSREMEDELISTLENSKSCYQQNIQETNYLKELKDDLVAKHQNITSSHVSTTGIDYQNVNDNMEIEEMEDQFMQIITKQLLENLQKFAHQQQHGTYDVKSHQHQFVIGSVQDKSERKIIRQYISYLYPHLQTVLQCKEDKVIVVKPNPSYNQFRDLLPEHQVDELMRFATKTHGTKTGNYAMDVDDLNKDQRRQLHHRISHLFGKFIESKTITKVSNNKSKNYIVVRYKSRVRNGTDDNNPSYLKFILRKRNRETLDALHYLAKTLRCRLSDFGYAGIKDCRALTYQQVTVKNTRPRQMIHALEKINLQEDIHCGHYQFSHKPIKLGELKGNRFRIIVRDVSLPCTDSSTKGNTNASNEVIQSMEQVQRNGFINYFGSQRFGKAISTVNTSDIGLAMLRNDEKLAVESILSTMENEKDNVIATALKYYHDSGDLAGTLVKIPSYKSRHVLLLKALHRYGQNSTGYRKALLSIPHNMRKMYIHSYCSLLWNRLVNYRIQTYGYDVVEGDLVLVDSSLDQVDIDVYAINQDQRVKQVTKEDLARRQYNIHDIVLPLLGSKTTFPTNSVGSVYQQMLSKDGITLHSFNNPQLDIKIKGAYRKMLCIPTDVTYSLHNLNCKYLHDHCHDCCSNILEDQSFKPCHDDHQRFHFKLEMTLNPGSYATVLLREITNNNNII